ncbi:hypothetical protein FK513_30325, partial [Klebsiella pneumoniae]|nr:hypothetical protein [Klebsiella pneumoniae]
MNAETWARVKAFRRALELAAGERSGEPVPSLWRDWLKPFPVLVADVPARLQRPNGPERRPAAV